MKLTFPFSILLLTTSMHALAAENDSTGVTWGGFVDAYYAYDINRPPSIDRAFTTQAARHNEFNVNLAYIEGKLERDRTRGRIALQVGTSVQSNYAGEPTIGSVSGPSLSRHIQEAYIGYRLGERSWIDAGIFFSHIGLESFISKDNLTYTRSLVADYSPYYETGVKFGTQFNENLSGQLLVLNGWQNISETNSAKALGTQLVYVFNPQLSVSYSTFVGRESSFRHFHDLVFRYAPSEAWNLAAQADIGFQDEAPGGGNATWGGFALIAKRSVSKSVAISARIERYIDPKQVLIPATNGHSFRAWSSSVGVDTELDSKLWWRNEIRGYLADEAVFPHRSGFKTTDGVIVSSISAAF